MIDAQAQFNRGTAPATRTRCRSPRLTTAGSTRARFPGRDRRSRCRFSRRRGTGVDGRTTPGLGRVPRGCRRISATLAADNLDQLKPYVAKLTTVAEALSTAFPADHPWHTVVFSGSRPRRVGPRPPTSRRAEGIPAVQHERGRTGAAVAERGGRIRVHESVLLSMAPKPDSGSRPGTAAESVLWRQNADLGEEVSPPAGVAKANPKKAAEPVHAVIRTRSRGAPMLAPPGHGHPNSSPTQPRTAARRGIAGYDKAATSLGTRLAEMSASVSNAPAAPKSTPPAAKPEPRAEAAGDRDLRRRRGRHQATPWPPTVSRQYQGHLTKLPDALAPSRNSIPPPERVGAAGAETGRSEPGRANPRPSTTPEAFPPLQFQRGRVGQTPENGGDLPRRLKIYHCPMAPKPGLWIKREVRCATPSMDPRC